MTVPKQLQGTHTTRYYVQVLRTTSLSGGLPTTHTQLFVHTYLYPTSYRVLIPIRPDVCAVCVHHRVCVHHCVHTNIHTTH